MSGDLKALLSNSLASISVDAADVDSPARSMTPFNVNAAEFIPQSARKADGRDDAGNTSLNANAPVFVPGGAVAAAADLAAGGNGRNAVPTDPSETVKEEICQIIHSMGMTGIRVTQLPHQYRRCTGKWLILSDTKFSTLSDVVDDIKARIEFIDTPGRPSTDRHPASTTASTASDKKLVVEPSVNAPGAAACPPLVIGHHADRIVMDKYFGHYSEELNFFRQLVVAVVRDFCLRNQCASGSQGDVNISSSSPIDAHSNTRRAPPHQRPAGLALSLFAAEWDRYFHGAHGLKEMRERFGVMKLMPFLHSIKELDIVGTHPEVRVRMKPEYLYSCPSAASTSPTTPKSLAARAASHAPPGFDPRAPVVSDGHFHAGNPRPAPPPQTNSHRQDYSTQATATALLAQQLLQSQQQLMAVISHQQQQLAMMGAPTSGQATELESLLSSLLAGMDNAHAGAANGSAISATNDSEVPQQPSSTSPTPVESHGTLVSSALISKDDLKQLLLSVVDGVCGEQARAWDAREDFLSVLTAAAGDESDSSDSSSYSDGGNSDLSFRRTEMDAKLASLGGSIPESLITAEREMQAQSKRNKTVGMPVSSVKRAWKRAYPSLNPLDFYMTYFGIRKLKFLLLEIPQLLLIGSGGSMRVATFAHALKYCDPFPSDCRSGATGFDSDEVFAGKNGLRQQLHKLLFDLVAEKCQEQQLAELTTRATLGDAEARGLLERYSEAGQSLSKEAERAKDGVVPPSVRGKPAPIDTTTATSADDDSMEEIIRMVPEPEGVPISDIERLWYEKYEKHLQPMLEHAGYRNASRLIHTCPGLRVFGHGVCMRCRVGKKASLSSPKTVDTRPSIITPETVPLPTPMKQQQQQQQQQGLTKTPICLADDLLPSAVESPVGMMNAGQSGTSARSSTSSRATPAAEGIFAQRLTATNSNADFIPAAIAGLYGSDAPPATQQASYTTDADALLELLSLPCDGVTNTVSTGTNPYDLYGYSDINNTDNSNSFLQHSPMLSVEGLLDEVDTPPTRVTPFGASPSNETQTALDSATAGNDMMGRLYTREAVRGTATTSDAAAAAAQEVSSIWKDPEELHKPLTAI
ncbi:hypothetical protein FOL46_007270 [Perkinsus olseni]|uniref:HTH OST-type domain-containing protein n=1 Tax=Perkinsus olseni TaxID=32597 RepID=A0A7J6LEU6_PEROL|nr:hypothetical protein FOL46_007270 [Perkinsus olseni]